MNPVTEDLLSQWKTCNSDIVNEPTDHKLLNKFTTLLNHVDAIDNLIPLRLLKKYTKCYKQTQSILAVILDHVQLTDSTQMTHLLKLYNAFANVKIIKLTYQLGEKPMLECADLNELKWFDLSCLLPVTSDTNWKKVYRNCFHKNTTDAELFRTVLNLYLQKLRLYAILENLDQYQQHSTSIRATAKEIVKKLVESNYSQHKIRMDEQFICVIMPYLDSDLYPIISEAIIQDRLNFPNEPAQNLITNQLLENNISMQTQLITTLLKHLRNNILRNKREQDEDTKVSPLLSIIEQITFEHMSSEELLQSVTKLMLNCESMDVDAPEVEKSFESIDFWSSIQSACNGASTSLTSKTVQTSYIANWLDVVQSIAKHQYLIIPNRLRIFTAASIVLISTSPFIQIATLERILGYMYGLIQDLPQKEAPIFFSLIPAGQYLIKLTNCLTNNTKLFEQSECSTFENFLSLFLNTYMNCTQERSDSLSDYVAFIVDEKLDKVVATYSQLIMINGILSTSTCNSRKSLKKAKNSVQLSIKPDLLQTIDPCISELKKKVAANQNILFSIDDKKDLYTSILTKANVSVIKLFIIQKDMKALKVNETFLKKLFASIVTNIGYLIQMHQTKHKSKKKKMNFHLCDDQFIDLIEFYNRYRTQMESVLNIRVINQLHDTIITSIVREIDQADEKTSSKLSKKMMKELKGVVLDESKLKLSRSKNSAITHIAEVEDVCYPEMKKILLKVAPLIFSACDAPTFQNSLNKILERILDCDISDHSLIVRSLILLESVYMAAPTYNLDKSKILADNFEKILASITKVAKQSECRHSIHLFKDAGIHKSMTSIKCCISARCLTSLLLLFRSPNQSKILKEELTFSSLQMISFANLRTYAQNSQYAYNQFLDLGSLTYSILNECLLKKSVVALNIMPTFNLIFTEFIRCLLVASDRSKLDKIKETIDDAKFEEIEHRFEVLALDTAKIMTQLSLMRSNFIGCAPYLISSYIRDVQIVTCHPRVRLHLDEGIFRIFNQIDAHQEEYKANQTAQANQRKTHAGGAQGSIFEMIHARLAQSSREIFRDMHENYEKFHRFTGRY